MGPATDGVLVIDFLQRALLDGKPLWPWQLALVLIGVLSILVLYRLTSPSGALGRRLRSRLLLGVPWGTVLALGFLLSVYLFVQGAYDGDVFDPRSPVTYAFIATSFEYPLGILTAAFSHQGFSHFFGNALGLAVFGSISEYAVSHFPKKRGTQAHSSWRNSPFVRPLGVFVTLVLVGLFTAVFTPGPIIGYSGVVYALAGFALLFRPLTTAGGLLVIPLLNNLYNTFTSPVRIWEPTFVPGTRSVWFADISIQGHFMGFLLGVLAAFVVLRWRGDERAPPQRIYVAAFVFGLLQNLWLLYLPADNGRFILFRAAGTALIFVLTALVVVIASDVQTPSLPWPSKFPEHWRTELPSRTSTTVLAFLVVVVAFSGVGVGLNLTTFQGTDLPNDPVEVGGYQIGYTENVTNQLYAIDIPLVEIPAIEEQTNVEASGVVVLNDRRHVWDVHTSTARLASTGVTRVTVGGVGWREHVWVTRTGWSVVGGGETYRVRLHPPDGETRLAFTAEPATADATVANSSITLQAAGENFEIVVERDNTTLSVIDMPSDGGNLTTAGLTFQRGGKNLYVMTNGTRFRIATKRVPPARRN